MADVKDLNENKGEKLEGTSQSTTNNDQTLTIYAAQVKSVDMV